ncbi:MAG: hypothetical protein JWM95_588 [Gemmatimonadetes bacterium]|nr:hypothetical protein [Gemmatimonadota bacterium]
MAAGSCPALQRSGLANPCIMNTGTAGCDTVRRVRATAGTESARTSNDSSLMREMTTSHGTLRSVIRANLVACPPSRHYLGPP